MSVSVLQQVRNDSTAAGLTISVSITTSANSYLHVLGSVDDSFSVSAIAATGLTFGSALDSIDETTDGQICAHWVSSITLATTYSVVITFNSVSADFRAIAVKEIAGSSGYDSAAAAHHANQQLTPTLAANAVTSGATPNYTSQPLLLSAFSAAVGGTSSQAPTAGTGFNNDGANSGLCMLYTGTGQARGCSKPLTSTTGVAATYTAVVNAGHITLAAAFLESAAATTFVPLVGHAAAAGMPLAGVGGGLAA